MTSPNGSRMPVSSSAWRSAISASNLEKRSRPDGDSGGSSAGFIADWTASVILAPPSARVLELADGVDELPHRLDLGLHVHGDQYVELVLDRGDEVHHHQAVPLEVAGEGGGVAERDALLVEGLDQLGHPGESLVAVGHGGPLGFGARVCQANRAGSGRTLGKRAAAVA